VPATKLVKVPQKIAPETASGSLLMGITALAMTRESYEVKRGDVVLVHAAAGGVGLLLCQLCRALGATVIGTASTKEKCDAALAAGATHMVNYKEKEDWVGEVMNLAPEGVNCV
jgi:NADPH:quinone reductase